MGHREGAQNLAMVQALVVEVEGSKTTANVWVLGCFKEGGAWLLLGCKGSRDY